MHHLDEVASTIETDMGDARFAFGLAAMDSKIGFRVFQDSSEPPGIMEGPSRAPSSPPDTPHPTKCSPRALISFSRRMVSGK